MTTANKKYITAKGQNQIIAKVEDLEQFNFPLASIINLHNYYLSLIEKDSTKELPHPISKFADKAKGLKKLFDVLPDLTPEIEAEIKGIRPPKSIEKVAAKPPKSIEKAVAKPPVSKPPVSKPPVSKPPVPTTGAKKADAKPLEVVKPVVPKEVDQRVEERRAGERRGTEGADSSIKPIGEAGPIEGKGVVHHWFPFEGKMLTFCGATLNIPLDTPQNFPITCPACIEFEHKAKEQQKLSDKAKDDGPKYEAVHNKGAKPETFRTKVYGVIEKFGPISIQAAAKKLAKKLGEEYDKDFVTSVRGAFHKLDSDQKIKKAKEPKA